jgi:hypothetical protein
VGQILLLVLIAVPAWAIWSVVRPRPAFVIRIAGGIPRISQGTVSREFVQEVSHACGRHGVRDAVVRGQVRGDRIALAFSGGIPEPCRQQLRNLWGLSGWSASPTANRRRRI